MQVFIIGSPLETAKALDKRRLNKQIIECEQILNAIDGKNLMDWQCFSGWNFVDGGRNIEINYAYEDYWSNTETYTEVDSITVSLEDVLKMMWSDNMSLEEVIDVIKNKK